MKSDMKRRCVLCLMLTSILSPKQMNGATTRDRHTLSTSTSAVITAAADAGDDDTVEKSKQLDAVLSRLEAAFRFMKDEAASLNLDAVIGTRMVEGAMSFSLTYLAFNPLYAYCVNS